MALPSVTNNSAGGATGTAPGYIYWQGFNIQYLGGSYSIPAGNTSERWVWWRYNGGGANTRLEAGADVPADLTDDDIVLLGNKAGIAVRVQSTSFVDGELLVDGSVIADALAVNAVNAKNADIESLWSAMLQADYVQAGFVLTGAIQIGDVGTPNPITISGTDGLVLPQPDGGEVRLPVDGTAARITADLIATSLSVKDDLTINGLGQVNGQIDLAQGVSTPKVAPVISQEWPSITTALGDGTTDNGNVYNALESHHSDPSLMVTAISLFGSGIRLLRRSNGALGQIGDPTSGKAWVKNFNAWGGICRIGSSYYVAGSDPTRHNTYVYRINATTWDKDAEILWAPDTYTDKTIRLVTDGTDVGVIWTIPSSGNLTIRWYKSDLSGRPTTTGRTADSTLVAAIGNQNVGGAVWGDTGIGGTRLWVAMKDTGSVYSFNPASNYARSAAFSEEFAAAGGAKICGMMYDDQQGRMISIDNYGRLWTYSKFVKATTIQAANTFYDGDTGVYPTGTVINGTDVGGTASPTHETLPSSTRTFNLRARAWPVFECPPPPDEKVQDATRVDKANRLGLYIAANGGTLYRYAYLKNTAGTAERLVRGIDVFPTSGPVPTSNTFAAAVAAPGSLRSQALRTDGLPMTYLGGDGFARLDGLIPPGTIVMSAIPGTNPPPGWLFCDGSEVSRTTYIALWDALRNGGTTSPFGNGNANSTFNLPDFRVRFPLGVGTGRVLGSTGGAMKITIAQMPVHSHTIAHTHGVVRSSVDGSTSTTAKRAGSTDVGNSPTSGPSTPDSGDAGSGADYLPPYQAVQFLIKT